MRRLLILGCLLTVFRASGAGVPQAPKLTALDAAYSDLEDSYPSTRTWGALTSMLTGGFGFLGGTVLIFDQARPVDEGITAYALATFGSIDGIDGLIRIARRSSTELELPHYKNFPA